MKRVALLSAALLLSVTASFGSGVLVEAESFRDKGGWAVDQQFMDQMGSPYLIAHGMGKPVADAVTTVEFPETGTYRVYVRTFNWVAPWYDGEGPGKFALCRVSLLAGGLLCFLLLEVLQRAKLIC